MFGFHPVNLAFRFILEIVALVSIGIGAFSLSDGLFAWVLGIGLPVVAATCWGVFNGPGDESRSGNAPVAVPGPVRLLIEVLVFAAAVALLSLVSTTAAMILAAASLVHYLMSLDRIRWLLAN